MATIKRYDGSDFVPVGVVDNNLSDYVTQTAGDAAYLTGLLKPVAAATGVGATDLAAIQAAITAVGSSPFYGGIALRKSTTNYALSDGFTTAGVDDLVIKGFGGVTLKAVSGTWSASDAMLTVASDRVRVEGVVFDMANIITTGRHIVVESATGTVIDGCRWLNGQFAAVCINNNAIDTSVIGGRIETDGYGVFVNDSSGSSGLLVDGVRMVHPGTGQVGDGVEVNCPTNGFARVKVVNCDISGYTGATSSAGIGIGGDNMSQAVIANNTTYGCEAEGIHVEDSTKVTVANNDVFNCGTAGHAASSNANGIGVFSTSYVTVSDNRVFTAGRHGILVYGTDTVNNFEGVVVADNQVYGAELSGIYVANADRPIIAGNVVRACSLATTATYYGIRVAYLGGGTHAAVNKAHVIGNTVVDGGGVVHAAGVRVDGTATATVEHNDLAGCATPASYATSTNVVKRSNQGETTSEWDGFVIAQDMQIRDAAGTARELRWSTSGSSRWIASANSAAESGSNLGSDWTLSRYTDAGALIDDAIKVVRASGLVKVTNTLRVDGTLQVAGSSAATTPGSVQKKLPVYDSAGSLLGYVALYDAIT